MAETVKTVKIRGGADGYIIINADDFDPAKHELFRPEETPAKKGGDRKSPAREAAGSK